MAKNEKDITIDLTSLAEDAGLVLLRDSDYAMVYDRLPLFLPRVDRILGGGFPFGRLVEIAGKSQGGKCLTKDAYILTPNGYKTVEQIINEQGLVASCTSKQVPAEIELINRYGEVEKTSHIHFNGKLKVRHIKTRTGLELKVTNNHPLLVIEDGFQVWKDASDIKEGDYVVTRRGDNIFGKKHLDYISAYSLGALVADGSFNDTSRVSFSNSEEAVLNKVREFLKKEFNQEPVEYSKEGSKTIELRVNNKQKSQEFYKKYGLVNGVAKDKHIPDIIVQGDYDTQVAFIQGYMDCESHVTNKDIEVTSASKKLLQQLQLLLKNLGIISYLKEEQVKGYEDNYYGRLKIYGKDVIKYLNIIGYTTDSKKGQIKSLDCLGKNNNLDDDHLFYDEVISVEDIGKEPTFDFTLPKTHSFIAESVVNHNSTLTHHAARVATALGCIVVLIDVEGTSDRERLSHLGIDISKVLVKQPDPDRGIALTVEEIGRTIEQTLEVFKKSYPDVPVVYIWDSVGQTPSEVELDKDYGEQNVGARAKAITQFVTKIAPLFAETKSLLLAINQVRDDIGGNPMFPTMTVPGGRAWEHAATLRLEIKKKQAIKKSQEVIGHTMGVKVNKSKVSRPFQEVNAFLLSDTGIDYEYNLAKMAEEEKILGGTSMSYEYTDLQGKTHKMRKDDFIDWLRGEEGAHVRQELLNKLIEIEFPEGYTALSNQSLDISGWVDQVHKPIPEGLEVDNEEQNTTEQKGN